MKRSKRLLSLLLATLVLLTALCSTTLVSAFAVIENSALSSYYATNPDGKVGKQATITIDGSFSDWSEDMLIAQGAAWDVANHYKGAHENCLLDTYALFGAWDNENLYIAWQMVNTTDTWHREGDGSLSDGGRVLDVPLILALRVDPSKTPMSNKNNQGGPIWGQKMGLTFETEVDHLLYMSGKPGLGEPSLFTAVDAEGNTDYGAGCKGFSKVGIEYKMAEGNICDSIWGLNYSEDPADVTNNDADWVDYKTFKGQMGTHNTKYDSFYEIKIPLSVLGIDANYLTTYGIGAMVVATRGESGLDCIPFDTTMLDNVMDSYGSDPSTSHEKDDEDVITVELARVGKSSGGNVTPTPTPTTAPTEAPTQAPTSAPVVTPTTTAEPTEVSTVASTPAGTDAPTPSVPIITLPEQTDPSETASATAAVPTLDFDNTTAPTTEATKPTTPDTADGALLGDTDLNGKVNIKDATLIQKHLAKIITLDEEAQKVSDVDANEVLNIRDVTYIQKWLAKMDVEFAIGEPMSTDEIIIPTTVTEAETTASPVIIPTTTVAPTTTEPTEAPTTAATEPIATTEATEPTTVTQPVVTEPIYTQPIVTEPIYTEPVGGDTITLYFENTNGWGSVYWHGWNNDGGTNTTWPGDMMENVSGNVYKAEVDATFTGIVFNDGSGSDSNKTTDLTIPGDGQIYSNGSWSVYDGNGGGNNNPVVPTPGTGSTVYFSNNKGWSTVYAYCWSGDSKNAEWPGVAMTYATTNEYQEDIYSYEVPAGMTNIIFTDGSSQTVDIDLNTVTQNGFYLVDGSDGKYGYGTYDYVG